MLIGTEQGSKTVEVVDVRDLNNAKYYIVRVGELEHFYTTQLQWAGHAREKKIESRMKPSLAPVQPGRSSRGEAGRIPELFRIPDRDRPAE